MKVAELIAISAFAEQKHKIFEIKAKVLKMEK